jgi:hypothetical protein
MKKNKPRHHPITPESLAEMTTDKELERRERRLRRLLTLEELIRLNRRVDEFSEGRHPPGDQLEVGFDTDALGRILRLVMEDLLRQRDYRQHGRPEEIRRLLRESQENVRQLQALPAELAAIVSQTYAELGEGSQLTDDEALHLIRERLLDYDGRLIDGQRARGVALVRAWRRREKPNVYRDDHGTQSAAGK